MQKRKDLIINLIYLLSDLLAIYLGLILAYFIRIETGGPKAFPVSGKTFVLTILLLTPIWIAILFTNGVYNLEIAKRRLGDLGKILFAGMSIIMILILVDFISFEPLIPARLIPIYGWIFISALMFNFRLVIDTVLMLLYRRGHLLKNTVLLGNNRIADHLESIASDRNIGMRIVKVLNLSDFDGRVEKIINNIKDDNIEQIILTAHEIDSEDLSRLISICNQYHVDFGYIPSASGIYKSHVKAVYIHDLPLLQVQPTTLNGWGRIFKRLFDVILAGLLLTICSPVFLFIMILQKIFNPGRIFYAHQRVGVNSTVLDIWKFRTMKPEFCTGKAYQNKTNQETLKLASGSEQAYQDFQKNFKLQDDPRVNYFGKILRRTSLDELPQLFNILIGKLSFVGPRPVTKEELSLYGKEVSSLLFIKPGLTGLWQVGGRNKTDYQKRVSMDLYYIRNWSMSLDIQILFSTAIKIIKGGDGL